MELTILMPCLNESLTIEQCIKSAQKFILEEQIEAEILIADNGSSDGSQNLAKKCGARVVNVEFRGYGAAIFHGSMNAKGKYVIVGDSDGSYNFYEIGPILFKLREGAHFVVGNRFTGGISAGAMPWKNRYIGNPFLSWLGRKFFSVEIGDFHCGLRGYATKAFKSLNLRTTGMEFASEMIIRAKLLEYKIEEVPVRLYKDGRMRKPHLRPWRDGFRHLSFMLICSPDWIFLFPGIFLFFVGLFLTVILSLGRITISSGVVLDIHTLLYSSCMLILGFQLIKFFILFRSVAEFSGLSVARVRHPSVSSYFLSGKALVIGIILFMLGLSGSVYALCKWGELGFGELDAGVVLRLVIPSVTMMLLGVQVAFLSIFIAFLKFRVIDEG